MSTDKRADRPESYPRPSETDSQWQNQPEYIDQQPNDFSDKSVSNVDVDADVKQTNKPEEMKEEG